MTAEPKSVVGPLLQRWAPTVVILVGLVASYTTLQVQVSGLREVINADFIREFARTQVRVTVLENEVDRLRARLIRGLSPPMTGGE